MKYFGFLLRFVIAPLIALWVLWRRDAARSKRLPPALNGLPPAVTLGALSAVAFTYTTPWDNYLVADKIWWYDRKKIAGILFGYVPIEEYSFFVLQTLLTGTWMMTLARYVPANEKPPAHPIAIRAGMTAAIGVIWAAAVWNLFFGPLRRKYLSITLSWALLPVMLQTAFGGDILWQHRGLVALGIVPTTLYLSVADSLAIEGGTWTINPEKTIPFKVAGKLPFEEGLFFFLTNVLISMGVTLLQSPRSRERAPAWVRRRLPAISNDERKDAEKNR